MSTIIAVKSNEVYEGFDVRSIRRCTPSVLGFRVCAELTANGDGSVTIRLTAETPFGNYSKSFKFNADVDFVFRPIPRVSIEVSIRDFRASGESISFSLSIKGCIKFPWPIGKRCVGRTFNIVLPVPGTEKESEQDLSSGDMALLLLAANEEGCQCD